MADRGALMTGKSQAKFVSHRRYRDPIDPMARFLELANAADADKGRISIGPINRTMLDEGASVEEYRVGRQRAIDEGLIEMHQSRAYVLFTPKLAERFA